MGDEAKTISTLRKLSKPGRGTQYAHIDEDTANLTLKFPQIFPSMLPPFSNQPDTKGASPAYPTFQLKRKGRSHPSVQDVD